MDFKGNFIMDKERASGQMQAFLLSRVSRSFLPVHFRGAVSQLLHPLWLPMMMGYPFESNQNRQIKMDSKSNGAVQVQLMRSLGLEFVVVEEEDEG